MKLVKEKSSNTYKIISDTELSTNPSLYVDRNDFPIYWELYGEELSDVILVKTNMKRIYDTTTWTNFRSTEEKESVARILAYFIPQVELDEVLTAQDIIDNKLNYVNKSKPARDARWNFLREQLALKVNQLDSLSFYTDTVIFKGDYIDVGLPTLQMWLTNGAYPALGIDFTSNGFLQASYYTVEMRDMCIDYLVYGEQFVST